MRWIRILILACCLFTACTVGIVEREVIAPTPTETVLPASEPVSPVASDVPATPTPVLVSATQSSPIATPNVGLLTLFPSSECMTTFTPRELGTSDGGPVYALSAEEWNSYLAFMGIESLCIPYGLGAPFIAADWDSSQNPNVTGRLLTMGFDQPRGEIWSPWTDASIVYSTYGAMVPAMVERFATAEDRDAVRAGTMPDMITIDGVQGFVRIHPGMAMGAQNLYKTYVFPFDTYYVAVVYDLGAYWSEDVEAAVQALRVGEYSPEQLLGVQTMDALVASIQFLPTSQP